uniref:Cytochrome P450 n=2 Tax=Aplanochytrium stocchinoi TaxID=215587 RepID=A0A6S8D206_9STRA|mmetsp:Transcript_34695/g.42785  ORF Transcript_34695/g.42785 Transcript_34695/m.42785 type:complete len:232 (-) Transcript_34695:383-1078(-)
MESMKLFKWIQKQFASWMKKEDEVQSLFLKELINATKRDKDDPNGHLTIREAESIIVQILLAGNDSSASTMGSAVAELARKPDMQIFLRENPDRIPDFIEEVLRLESPFNGHFRKVKKEEGITLHGQHLPKGTRVMLLWGSGNRDEGYWKNPEEFSIERENRRSHLSFGSGIHSCLGQKLARLEVKVVLEELLKRTQNIEIGQTSGKLKYLNSTFVRSLEKLPLRLSIKQK